MKVTGFTFIRNAVKFDYPVLEAIQSILPVCTDFVVAIGNSEDDTEGLINSIGSSKIRIVHTVWDDTVREGGRVLALETDKALAAIDKDADWCFYIQADEVVHERYLDPIRQAMERYKNDEAVDGLLLKYLHFYGSYDYIGLNPSLYQNEIRIIRRNHGIYSYRDAQGFRKGNNEKLCVKAIDAYMYHYGYVKDPIAMQKKHELFGKLWHSDEWMEANIEKQEQYDYTRSMPPLGRFETGHPAVMEKRVREQNWPFKYDASHPRFTMKQRMKIFLERKLGFNVSYRNYKLI